MLRYQNQNRGAAFKKNICEIEPSTSFLRTNVYHLHLPLFILDAIRVFQDHPKYVRGINEVHLIALLERQTYACGDIESQVKTALKDLCSCGFIRYVCNGYRTLGPFARLATARTARQFNIAWERLYDMQKITCSNPAARI